MRRFLPLTLLSLFPCYSKCLLCKEIYMLLKILKNPQFLWHFPNNDAKNVRRFICLNHLTFNHQSDVCKLVTCKHNMCKIGSFGV